MAMENALVTLFLLPRLGIGTITRLKWTYMSSQNFMLLCAKILKGRIRS